MKHLNQSSTHVDLSTLFKAIENAEAGNATACRIVDDIGIAAEARCFPTLLQAQQTAYEVDDFLMVVCKGGAHYCTWASAY